MAGRRLLFLLMGVLAWAAQAEAAQVVLTADSLEGPDLQARAVRATLSGRGFDATAADAEAGRRRFRQVRLVCPDLVLAAGRIDCLHGSIRHGEARPWPLDFRYTVSPGVLQLALHPAANETWQASARFQGPATEVRFDLQAADPSRLNSWLPEAGVRPKGGRIDGRIALARTGGAWRDAQVDLRFAGLAFSDVAGLRAGEGMAGSVSLAATPEGGSWRWQGTADWSAGEVFWQPFYLTGRGHRLSGNGTWRDGGLVVEQAALDVAGVGRVSGAARWDAGRLASAEVQAAPVSLDGAHTLLIKPLLAGTAFAESELQGSADVHWIYRDGATRSLDLTLRKVAARDGAGRYSVSGLDAVVPWRESQPAEAQIAFAAASVGRLPLGTVRTRVLMRGLDFTVPRLSVPLLDGALELENFHAKEGSDGWQFAVAGKIAPLSMERLTEALGWPRLHGSFSAGIPQVTYAQGRLQVDGVLFFHVFDGTVIVDKLQLLEPLGRAPRASADITASNLDLDLITRAFSFGRITGRVDASVHGLELADWRPARFDAKIASSPGRYPKRISQRAVENISALGGSGAVAAIERSFLRFFEDFGYSRLGLSCALRNGVCLMDGVAPAPNGYVIVQGGGIPAITVIGYNRSVDWDELLDRLRRVTQSDVAPVVR